jgi:hypothetical protein
MIEGEAIEDVGSTEAVWTVIVALTHEVAPQTLEKLTQ